MSDQTNASERAIQLTPSMQPGKITSQGDYGAVSIVLVEVPL